MGFAIFLQQTWKEFLLLLNAPLLEPEMWWIIAPLAVTFLVMIFYFGLYTKEELGWNTALGNTIVLLFVAIDLLKTIYNYTEPASWANFGLHAVKFIIIFIVIVEAILLFYSAFTHGVPKYVIFFLASPLPVNLQAYVIASIVYLKVDPNWYTLSAAFLLFVVLFLVARVLQFVQGILVELSHKRKVALVKELKKEAKKLKKEAKDAKGKAAKDLRETAKNKLEEAKALKEQVVTAERIEHGAVKVAKALLGKKD